MRNEEWETASDKPFPSPLTHRPLPLSLYIHIPWCVKKCPYCDFNSHEARGEVPEAEYTAALLADLEQALPLVWGRKLSSIFFGGGTPSLLSERALDDILGGVRARLPLVADAEITLEANPGTFEADKFSAFRAAGVNRLSIGIQSFNPHHLQALGRIHDDRQARAAVECARRHFDNINLDLMFALPEQTLAETLQDMSEAIAFAPQHISAYQLTLEPGTRFHRSPPSLPDADLAADMQQAVAERLAEGGYRRYEISAYASTGRRCLHNLNYWNFGDYLGIGAGAHSKISLPGRIVRQERFRQPSQYVAQARQGQAVRDERVLTAADLPFEFMMNALRLTDGFSPPLFEARTGLALETVAPILRQAQARGLLAQDEQQIRPTEKGRDFLNDLLQMFLA
ncbi:MAG: radical SAM family heme chaperone HemW [Sulfuricellaceae bacterium]|nr:radical SAM family heme chaperone HemW [Sulfuricellaceae bacterium]